MKKILNTLVVFVLLTSAVNADLIRIESGIGAWNSKSSGAVTYTANSATASDNSAKKSSTDPYLWVLFKHPTPVVPNMRVEYTTFTSKGIASGSFKNFTASASPTQLDSKQIDLVAYYNLLDNTAWTTLDLGLDIKGIDASYSAQNVTLTQGSGNIYSDSKTIILPLLYVRARVEVPSTDVAFEADLKYVEYSSSSLYDARLKIDYTLDVLPAIDPAIELGYRVQSINVDEDSLAGKVDLEFSGFYAGLMMRF